MSDNELVNGLYPKQKHENAPDFVLGKVSINLEQFMPWLRQWCKDNPGEQWVNIEMLISRGGKPYAKVDSWKPEPRQDSQPEQSEPAGGGDFEDDIPF
jgi:hypothetical protein